MSQIYYWSNSLTLSAGSIVGPGNWYKIVSSTPGHFCALREEVTESIRRNLFPDMPSRKTSIFLCSSEVAMKSFLAHNPRPADIIYKVELVDENAKICEVNSDLNILQNMQEGGRPLTTVELEEQARAYWDSAKTSDHARPEIVTESSIRILESIACE